MALKGESGGGGGGSTTPSTTTPVTSVTPTPAATSSAGTPIASPVDVPLSNKETPAVEPATPDPAGAAPTLPLPEDETQVASESQLLQSASMLAHGASFTDSSDEAMVSRSMQTSDVSAAVLATSHRPEDVPVTLPAEPRAYHRGSTLDRGLDVLAAQNLSIAPDGAGPAAARSQKRKKSEDPDALPVLSPYTKKKYCQFWHRFRNQTPPPPKTDASGSQGPQEPIPPPKHELVKHEVVKRSESSASLGVPPAAPPSMPTVPPSETATATPPHDTYRRGLAKLGSELEKADNAAVTPPNTAIPSDGSQAHQQTPPNEHKFDQETFERELEEELRRSTPAPNPESQPAASPALNEPEHTQSAASPVPEPAPEHTKPAASPAPEPAPEHTKPGQPEHTKPSPVPEPAQPEHAKPADSVAPKQAAEQPEPAQPAGGPAPQPLQTSVAAVPTCAKSAPPKPPSPPVSPPPVSHEMNALVTALQELGLDAKSRAQVDELILAMQPSAPVAEAPTPAAPTPAEVPAPVPAPTAAAPAPTLPPAQVPAAPTPPPAEVPAPVPAPMPAAPAVPAPVPAQVPAQVPAPAAPTGVPSAPVAPIPASALPRSMPPPPAPGQANSGTHPSEYAAFKRFCLNNAGAKELKTAFNKGGEARLSCFRQYLQAGCNALALEAVLRFTRQSEVEDKDGAEYCKFSEILAYFGGDSGEAMKFIAKRRGEPSGTFPLVFQSCSSAVYGVHFTRAFLLVFGARTSTDRNTGEETFLWFGKQQKTFTTKQIAACLGETWKTDR